MSAGSYQVWDWEAEVSGWHGFSRRYARLDDGSWYWHLYFRDARVNGGLSESLEAATADSARAMALHGLHPA